LPVIRDTCDGEDTVANPIEALDLVDVVEESKVCVTGLAQFRGSIMKRVLLL